MSDRSGILELFSGASGFPTEVSSGSPLPVSSLNPLTGSSGLALPNFIGTVHNAQTINASVGTGSVTLMSGAPGYYLNRFFIEVDPTCTTSGGGLITLNLVDSASSVNVAQYRFYAPAAFTPPSSVVGPLAQETGAGFFFLAPVSGSTLSASLSVAL